MEWGLGCCCVRKLTLGFFSPYNGATPLLELWLPCLPVYLAVNNLNVNISRLGECDIVFIDPIFYNEFVYDANMAAVVDWLNAGGKIFIYAEAIPFVYSRPFVPFGSPPPLRNSAQEFDYQLAAYGSSMRFGGGNYTDYFAASGSAAIAQGLSGTRGIEFTESGAVTGGTSVFIAAGAVCLSAERVGNGIVFACGDSNFGKGNSKALKICKFIDRLVTWTPDEMI